MTGAVAPPVRDYLLGTTHRKDALEGALWATLRRQLAGISDATGPEIGSTAEPPCEGRGIVLPPAGPRCASWRGAGDAAAGLARILEDAAGIVRWEPINPNAEHRTCPSPGSRFTVDLEIGCRRGAGARWFRYLPRERMLAELPEDRAVDPPGHDRLLFVLRGHVGRCAEPYGDLAQCLATIETGAMLAQLALALGGARLAAQSARFACSSDGLDPIIQAQVHAPALARWLAGTSSAGIRFMKPVDRSPDEIGGRLLRGVRLGASAAAAPDLFPQGVAATDRGAALLPAVAGRSSGLNFNAVADGTPDPRALPILLDTLVELHSAFRGLGELPFRLDVRSVDASAAAAWAGGGGVPPPWLHLAPAAVTDRAGGTDDGYPVGAVVITISADLKVYTARAGAAALAAMHLAAGIATQIVCIAAARARLACRPMRSFDHAAADAALPLENWSLIQLVVYDDRAPNPAFALASSPKTVP